MLIKLSSVNNTSCEGVPLKIIHQSLALHNKLSYISIFLISGPFILECMILSGVTALYSKKKAIRNFI